MEQSRKNFRISAIVVLIFAGISLLQAILALLFMDFNVAELPANSPENIILITKILLLVVSLLLVAPQVYIGIRGLQIAKNPQRSKGHIVWAIILFAFAGASLVMTVATMIGQGGVGEHLSAFFGAVLELVVYFDYIKYARDVLKECC